MIFIIREHLNNTYSCSFKDFKVFVLDKYVKKYINKDRRMVLDFGCDDGTTNMSFFNELGWKCVGNDIDISTHAKKWGDLVIADGQILPFKNCTFDLIVCEQVLHHIKQPTVALYEMKRILRKNGLLLINETVNDNPLIRIGRSIYPYYDGDAVECTFYKCELESYIKKNFDIIYSAYAINIVSSFLGRFTKDIDIADRLIRYIDKKINSHIQNYIVYAYYLCINNR